MENNWKCDNHSETKDQFNNKITYKCQHKAKYQVSFIEGSRGTEVCKNLCGIHYRSLLSYKKRMDKIGFDIKLAVIEID